MKYNISNTIFPYIWLILCLIVFYTFKGITIWHHNFLVVFCVVSYILCFKEWLGKGNRLFSVFSLFMVYSLFSNLGQSILYCFTDEFTLLNIYGHYKMEDICYMLRYNVICGAGMYLGLSLYLRKSYRNVSAAEISDHYLNSPVNKSTFGIYDALLYFCLAMVAIYAVYQLQMRQSMSYAELYESRDTTSGYFSFGAIIFGLYSILRKRNVTLVIASWAFFLLAYFMAGTRSMAIIYVGALVFVTPIIYPKLFQKEYYVFWIVGLFFGISILSVISSMRTSAIGSNTGSADFAAAFFDSINEMGISQHPTIVTMHEVDQGLGHCYTIFYNIFLGFIPSSILDGIVPQSWLLMPGRWINDVSDITHTEIGFSWIAESYLNFGQLGWIFTGIYVYLIAFAENYSIRKIKHGDYLFAICMLSILCKQIFYARAQINLVMSFYKPCIYIFYLWLIFGKKNSSKIKNDLK